MDDGEPNRVERRSRAATPWWDSMGWWRGLATFSLVLAFAFGVTLFAPRTERPPEQVVVVLAGPDAKPALIASADRGSRYLNVKAVAPLAVASDRALQLWMLPPERDPLPLGLVPASGLGRIALGAPAGIALQRISSLAVSVEAAGGSPTGKPTGALLYSGPVERLYE
jgi:anti-sigma-K factor RskA